MSILIDIDDLLQYSGPVFLGNAYLRILGRPIDPDGFRTYEIQLQAGISKLSIIEALVSSPEGKSRGCLVPGLSARLVRERGSSSVGKRSMRELLELNGSAFVDGGYFHLYGRLPTVEERLRWLNELSGGVSKEELLLMMASHPAGASLQSESPAMTVLAELQAIRLATDVGSMLALDDAAFLDYAYNMILGRAPDPAGFSYYLRCLREGCSKWLIISSLALSGEGRAAARRITGLRVGVVIYGLGRLPCIGWFFRALLNAEGETPLERSVRRIEYRLGLLSAEAARTRVEGEAAIASVDRLLSSGSGAA
jgi:hypothetical protein